MKTLSSFLALILLLHPQDAHTSALPLVTNIHVREPGRARRTTSTCTRPRRCESRRSLSHHDVADPFLRSPYAINRYLNESKRLYGVLEERLKGREYILGSYGIADIKAFGWVRAAPRLGLELDEFPRVKAWVERIEARPAVQAGIAAATPPKKE